MKRMKVTADTNYIIMVNVLTNLILNSGSIMINRFFGHAVYMIWVMIFEALIIPVSEAVLYSLISHLKFSKIVCVSYIANLISFIFGTVCISILKEIFL